MQYSVISNTDVRVSRIALGTASMHHLFSAAKRQRLLAAAAFSGITHFDTSPYYGYGLAEADLGGFMQGRRHAFSVTTKVGLYPPGGSNHRALGVWTRKAVAKLYPPLSAPEVDWRVKRAAQSLSGSLLRLRTDYVDFLFLHEPNIHLVNADEFLVWLDRERAAGRVRYWGLAGLPHVLSPWLQMDHALARVLQTRDDLSTHSADFAMESGRPLQFTYGYLASQNRGRSVDAVADVLPMALARNSHGSILVSTRRSDRVTQLANLCQ